MRAGRTQNSLHILAVWSSYSFFINIFYIWWFCKRHPMSDYANAQARLVISCPHIPYGAFSCIAHLMGTDTLSRVVTLTICLPTFLKGLTLKGRKLPLGSKFFHFREDPFSEGALYAGKETLHHRSYLPCKNGRKPTKCIQSPNVLHHNEYARKRY